MTSACMASGVKSKNWSSVATLWYGPKGSKQQQKEWMDLRGHKAFIAASLATDHGVSAMHGANSLEQSAANRMDTEA